MQKVFFSRAQQNFLCRSISTYISFLREQNEDVQCGRRPTWLEQTYLDKNAVDEVDKDLARAEVQFNNFILIDALYKILEIWDDDQQFYDMSEGQLKKLNTAVHIYLLTLATMSSPSFLESGKDVSFFEKEINYGKQLDSYLTSLCPEYTAER